jgi:uncharacterized protein YacL
MSEEEKQVITVDGVEHNVEDLTDQQVAMVKHIQDIDGKIATANFNLDQLKIARNAFMKMLNESFAPAEAEAVAEDK